STGTCNVACTEAGRTCPAGYVCGGGGTCEVAPPPVEDAGPVADGTAEIIDPPVEPSGGACTTTPRSSRTSSAFSFGVVVFLACAAAARRIGMGRRSGP
ncbi:MAG TPA: hypothetical protein VM925_09845, partial [Labilithrix sp.]|nr:hypothetical protein [Labilithrix sp.]